MKKNKHEWVCRVHENYIERGKNDSESSNLRVSKEWVTVTAKSRFAMFVHDRGLAITFWYWVALKSGGKCGWDSTRHCVGLNTFR